MVGAPKEAESSTWFTLLYPKDLVLATVFSCPPQARETANRYALGRTSQEGALEPSRSESPAECWRRKVLERRGSRHKRSFTHGLAQEYDLKLRLEGYPGSMIDEVATLLGPGGSLLDIGGGTGLWALPIARRGHPVTVVEPSEAMRGVLEDRLRAETSLPVRVAAQRWEDVQASPHTLVLCAHAVYGMDDIEPSLAKMERAARSKVALFVRTSRWPGRLSSELVASLGGKALPTCNWADLQPVLDARGTRYRVDEVRRSVDPAALSLTGFPEATAWLEERLLRPAEPADDDGAEVVDVWVTWEGLAGA